MLFTGEKMHELSPQWLKRICSCASIKPVSVWQESIWYITLWFRCMGGLVLQKNLSRVPSGAICDKEDAQCWLNWCVYSGYFYPYAFRFLSYTCYISIVSSFETSGFNITGSPLDDLCIWLCNNQLTLSNHPTPHEVIALFAIIPWVLGWNHCVWVCTGVYSCPAITPKPAHPAIHHFPPLLDATPCRFTRDHKRTPSFW